MKFKQWLEAYRIDSEKIPDFSKELKTYFRSPDYFSSGTFSNDILPDQFKNWKFMGKGLFASKNLKDVVPYAIPRNIPWILANPNSNKPTLYIDKKYQYKLKQYNPYLTKLNPKDFSELPSGELFSQLPKNIEKQELIKNPVKFIKQYMNLTFVNDLKQTKIKLEKENIPFYSEGF